jgi:hypothetical protein
VRNEAGELDLRATFEASAPLIEAGVTDLRISPAPAQGFDASLELYSEIVSAFRLALH